MYSDMNPKICVICRNSKPVNQTDNRLVTENCGHVKCMNCLLLEKSGCVACLREGSDQESGEAPTDSKELVKKKKPETSHVRIVTVENEKFYECTVCEKRFHARSQVAYHAYCNGQRKPYQCPECNKSFATHSHFKYHMRVHRNERTYACDVCGDSFFQMSKLQRHKLKHTKEKKYACTVCNKGFNNLTSLRKHSLTHTEERPYQCSACGRRFRDGSNYRKHVAKHEMKKCGCEGCGGSGACCVQPAAARALRSHQCPRCPQAFHSGKDMRRHAAVHSDSKPFRCKVCNRRFRRKDNLERHIRNTHPEYVPATAVECDEGALKQVANTNGQSEQHIDKNGATEINKLEILEQLPILTQEVIEKHMYIEVDIDTKDCKDKKQTDKEFIDKSYILEANNARESVIVEKRNTDCEKKAASPAPEYGYVHKIRRANLMRTSKEIPLPPIDEQKMMKLKENSDLNEFHSRPPIKNVELYKMILTNDKQMLSQVSPGADTEA
ncbi:zinc finger protein 557 isoform X2 [Papilio machaon]|uniref:zinc finger protein 557 isoform X2 n=1 Tax=Papilio machaon TaxID=76193 RepID=UPI001E664CF6|nr:zinc finger protein 557 isoform X2 [Papilio machaon]